VDPGLYDRTYFLKDDEGGVEWVGGLDAAIHPKFKRALELAGDLRGKRVLDMGCGRGDLLYYCARRGAAAAIGVDYSRAAVEIAKETIKRLPPDLQGMMEVSMADIEGFDSTRPFDAVFMIDVVEHMYTWQLAALFDRLLRLISPDGRLIIITPNRLYEDILAPAKRVVDMPLNLVKIPLRVARGRYPPGDAVNLLKKAFRVFPERSALHSRMHVNVMTPFQLKRLLSKFDARVWCEDQSSNLLSLLTRGIMGRTIIAVAKILSRDKCR
jgi:SAM-dependent methyltransferase